MSFSLATLQIERRNVAAICIGDRFWPLTESARKAGVAELPQDLMKIMASWRLCWPSLERLAFGYVIAVVVGVV